jgi:hypothetical protein
VWTEPRDSALEVHIAVVPELAAGAAVGVDMGPGTNRTAQ